MAGIIQRTGDWFRSRPRYATLHDLHAMETRLSLLIEAQNQANEQDATVLRGLLARSARQVRRLEALNATWPNQRP